MHIAFEELGSSAETTEVCIIGSGAAGLPMAVRLAQKGYRVTLCEGGDQEYSTRSQEIYRGEAVGDPYIPLRTARLRFFGGSTNHWGGVCRPLDTYDFTAKAAAPQTAWPIGPQALAPYYAEAANVLDVGAIGPDQEIPGSGLKRIHFYLGSPARLKQKYAETVRRLKSLRYCSAANLFGFETVDGTVTRATFKSYDGRERSVQAHYFVLACGGIENSRLLLWSNRQSNGQLVKQPATLGRYWMDHPHATIGKAIIIDPARLGLDRSGTVYLAPTRSTLAERGILNCGLRLHRMNDPETEQLIDELSYAAPALGRHLNELAFGNRLLAGVLLRAAWEQEPRWENRVELDTTADKLGMPRARLVWRKSALDVQTVRDSTLTLGGYLRDNDIGRVKLADWLAGDDVAFPEDGEIAGRHHMGGTRMALTPEEGIVDTDCRVFGQKNLYVAGSSVFPSSGHANPTLTLVQLAMRLAVHLEDRLGQRV